MANPERPILSIIIPVYKTERFIERCVRSLFEQTLPGIEYIFVDDCSPDKSINIIQKLIVEYPNRAKHVRIIHHKENKGIGTARINGMRVATGLYSFHCDSDDWLPLNAMELLINKALETDADIVSGSSRCHFHDHEEIKLPRHENEIGIDIVRKFRFNFPLWHQIIRTPLLQENNIYPIENINFGEDNSVTIKAFALAKKVYVIDEVIYNYDCTRINNLSSMKFQNKIENLNILFDDIRQWLISRDLLTAEECDNLIYAYQNAVKFDLIGGAVREISKWYNTWPESTRWYISKLKYHQKIIYFLGKKWPCVLNSFLNYTKWREKRYAKG